MVRAGDRSISGVSKLLELPSASSRVDKASVFKVVLTRVEERRRKQDNDECHLEI